MKYLFIYLFSLTSSFALTAADCELNTFSTSKAFVTKEHSITCEKINNLQKTVEDVSLFFEDSPEVRLLISLKSSNASFDYGGTIYIPLQITFPGKYGSLNYGDSTQTEYILAHEYGHAIFSKLLSRNSFYREIYLLDKEVSNLEFKRKMKTDFNESSEQRLIELTEKKNSYNKIRRILADYSEFFADVIAVYFSSNKDTMVNALYFDEMSDQSYNLVLARSFSERSVDIRDRIYTEEHASLVLARHFVGKRLWPKSKEEKDLYLDLIFTAIEQEILDRIDREEYKMNAKDLNESLINRLELVIK